MSNVMMILDILIVLGLVVSAVMAVHFEKLLSAVISLGVTGLFAAAAFLLMHAPDVAISVCAESAPTPMRLPTRCAWRNSTASRRRSAVSTSV